VLFDASNILAFVTMIAARIFAPPSGTWLLKKNSLRRRLFEDVPFAVELRDGGPGVVLRQARA
jgi:hypothetical protein